MEGLYRAASAGSQVTQALQLGLSSLGTGIVSLTAGPIDHLYSRISSFNGPFFPQGWGDLQVEEDLKYIRDWPPPELKVDWKVVDQGRREGVGFKLLEGSFKTPCLHRVYDALPLESRTAYVQMLVPEPSLDAPKSPSPASRPLVTQQGQGKQGQPLEPDPYSSLFASEPACALFLAATGDQGYARRMKMAGPLLKHGVSVLALESPFYGPRRPEAQRGSKLRVVSDLLTLGWATIFESICLLHMMRTSRGYQRLGISGMSMGGVHACMTAGLYHGPVACTPLLAPRSAAVAYCDGAMHAAMAWDPLHREMDEKNNSVGKVVFNSARAVSVMNAAKYALLELEAAVRDEEQGGTPDAGRLAGAAAAIEAASAEVDAAGAQRAERLAAERRTSGEYREGANGERAAEAATQQPSSGGLGRQHAPQHAHPSHVKRQPSYSAPAVAPHSSSSSGGGGDNAAYGRLRPPFAPHTPSASPASESSGNGSNGGGASTSGLSLPGLGLLPMPWLGSSLDRLQKSDKELRSARTVSMLKQVLETFTDVTRYPRPQRPDAAVMVAAVNDAYVSLSSVRAMHEYWPGSELRVVSGGHVSGFLLQQPQFRTAVLDSLKRL